MKYIKEAKTTEITLVEDLKVTIKALSETESYNATRDIVVDMVEKGWTGKLDTKRSRLIYNAYDFDLKLAIASEAVIGWSGITYDNGNAIEFSQETFIALFKQLPRANSISALDIISTEIDKLSKPLKVEVAKEETDLKN